jgi:hypothetical protein
LQWGRFVDTADYYYDYDCAFDWEMAFEEADRMQRDGFGFIGGG